MTTLTTKDLLNHGTELTKIKQADLTQKAKEKNVKSGLAIKKAAILGALPTQGGTMGDGLIAGADSMAKGPKNGWTGLVEGLMRGFGINLKGKEAEEKRTQIEHALEWIDFAEQGKEYMGNVKSQIAQESQDLQPMPSSNQYQEAVKTGTIEPTIQSILQEKGVDASKVSLSSDTMSVFVDNGQQGIQKIAVSSLFNPEDSPQFSFANSMVKANLEQSANEQVRGLAQENNALKNQLSALEKNLIQNGVTPEMAQYLVQQAQRGDKMELDKLGNETTLAEARAASASTARDRLGFEKDHYDQDFEERKRRNDIMEQNANQRLKALGLKNVKEVVPVLRSIHKGIHLCDEVMADAEKYPDVFRSALSSWINTNGDSGAFSLLMQKALPGYSDKEKDALMRVTKNLNQLMLTELKGLGSGGNLTVDGWIKQGTINSQYSVENVQHLLGQVKSELKISEKIYDKALEHSGGDFISEAYRTHKPGHEKELQEIRKKTEGPTQPQTPPANTQSGATGRVRMIKPDGSAVFVLPDKVTSKISEEKYILSK